MRKPKLNIERLKEKREAKGWTKNYAAEEMGILQSAYVRYESGERAPSFSVIKNMALTLGTSIEYLTDKYDDDAPMEMIVSCRDKRLSYIVDFYNQSSNEDKERIYKYVKKLGSPK
ncbi:MAG: helix-turn-helix transcriptional regulator [Butyrivibrio sp.]|nr:helix-turn-helix transcriptional regulator [Butyrivibrio sp.]